MYLKLTKYNLKSVKLLCIIQLFLDKIIVEINLALTLDKC